MDKTEYKMEAEVETAYALSKTLQAQTEMLPMNGAVIPMYAVYGRDVGDRKVWCCTFVDRDEAAVWVHSSKTFGRPVKGAVVAKKEADDGAGTDTTETIN